MVILAALALAAPAHAAFPGANGRIAFQSDRNTDSRFETYSVNADGSGEISLTGDPARSFTDPAWSPDGKKVAFACHLGNEDPQICTVNPDGSGWHVAFDWYLDVDAPVWSPDGSQIAMSAEVEHPCPDNCLNITFDILTINSDWTTGVPNDVSNDDVNSEVNPAWSPDGSQIAYSTYSYDRLHMVRPDGTMLPFTGTGRSPNWSPDGSRLAYDRSGEIYVANADGTNETRITNNSVNDADPAWSPDGEQIAFASDEGGDYEIFTMNADGTGRHPITSNTAQDRSPDWQPIPLNYARPRGAAPSLIYLVPAYDQCTAPNRTHGSPLAFGSCAPPTQTSSQLTLGTPDANGHPAVTIGTVRYRVAPGDVKIDVNVTGVATRPSLAPYGGELALQNALRITDRDNMPSPGGPGPATVQDASFPVTVPCVAGTCSVATTANAVAPGAVTAGQRAIWQLGQVKLYDGGADGVASTIGDNSPFMVEGVFIP